MGDVQCQYKGDCSLLGICRCQI